MCPRDLNETQVGDIGDYASAIGVEKHYLHLCPGSRRGHNDFGVRDLRFTFAELIAQHRPFPVR